MRVGSRFPLLLALRSVFSELNVIIPYHFHYFTHVVVLLLKYWGWNRLLGDAMVGLLDGNWSIVVNRTRNRG